MIKALTVVTALLVLATSTVIPRTSPITSHAPRMYRMNIDDDPKTRWSKIIPDYKEPLDRLLEFFDILPLSKSFFNGVDEFSKHYAHQDFVEEVRAVSELSGFDFDKLFFLNFIYEFSRFKACTGIIARNSEGKILHARNMDFEMWELFSKLAITVEYFKVDKNGV